MAWDSSRPVPWQRLIREWFVYVGVMVVVFVLFFRDSGLPGILGGLLASGPLYLALGYVLAKFGYRRQTLGELRERRLQAAEEADPEPADAPRAKPAPTRRTGGGTPARRKPKRRR